MSSNSKEIVKLKKQYSKRPTKRRFFESKSVVLEHLPAYVSVLIIRKFINRSDYRSKRESIKFFRLINIVYGAKKSRKCDRFLRIALGLLDSNFPTVFATLLRNAVAVTLEHPERRGEISHSVLIATKQFEPTFFNATFWYQLSRGLFSLGYFRAAWVARENSLDLSILEATVGKSSSTALKRGIQAHIERRNLVAVSKILLENSKRLSDKHLSYIKSTVSLFENGYALSRTDRSSASEASCELFSNLIFGKTVAIVGAGQPHGDYGTEIDEFDTVIRIKFIGREMLDGRNFHGSRTDISFIGAIDAVKLQESELQDEFKSFKLILANPTAIDSIGTIPVYQFESNADLYRTPTTAGLRTISEVLQFSPSKLKLYGFDFYTTLMARSKEITAFYESSSWKFGHSNNFIKDGYYLKFMRARDFSEHDPISNFCFAQNLYKSGFFEIELFGKKILELTPYQYAERLEEMLGDW